MRWRIVLLLTVVQMLEEVEQSQIASFVPHADLRAFFVFVTAHDISLKEVVPRIASLESRCVEEFNLLPFNREQEVLS